MDAMQALMKYKIKMKSKTKIEVESKTKMINQKDIIPVMYISQLEYDWYVRLCPNFNRHTLHIKIKTNKK
jgi:hypothetical protein